MICVYTDRHPGPRDASLLWTAVMDYTETGNCPYVDPQLYREAHNGLTVDPQPVRKMKCTDGPEMIGYNPFENDDICREMTDGQTYQFIWDSVS